MAAREEDGGQGGAVGAGAHSCCHQVAPPLWVGGGCSDPLPTRPPTALTCLKTVEPYSLSRPTTAMRAVVLAVCGEPTEVAVASGALMGSDEEVGGKNEGREAERCLLLPDE